MSALISHTINASVINQRSADGYIHATAMCQAADKRLNNYLRNDTTIEYLDALASDARISVSQLIISKKGNSKYFTQGTWVHPKVAIHLAQWLSPQFAVQVTNWVYDWMNGQLPSSRPEETRIVHKGGLTKEQQDVIKQMVNARIDAAPKEAKAKTAIKCWSAIKKKFGCTYKDIAPEHFPAVVSLVARLATEEEEQQPSEALPFPLDELTRESKALMHEAQGLSRRTITLFSKLEHNQISSSRMLGFLPEQIMTRNDMETK